jgi:ribosomal-protein-alanine N-acetyltransferase
VVNFGFIELYIERIEVFPHIQNEKSKNLLLKNGFKIIEDRKDNDDLSNIVFEIRKSK